MSTNKTSAPVLGFNHNLKFGSRVYHVQTEDSGLPHEHYITHLFVGGNVLASMKTNYHDKADAPDLAKLVRSLMEAQHKAMVKRLVSGEFNAKVQLFAPSYEPGVLATGQTSPEAMNVARTAPAAASAMSGSTMGTPAAGSPRMPPARPPPSPPPLARAAPPAAPTAVPLPSPTARPPVAPRAAPPRQPTAPLTARPPPAWPATPPPATSSPWPSTPSQPAAPRAPPSGPPRQPGAPLPSTTRAPPVLRPVQPPMVAPIATRSASPPLSKNPFGADAFAPEKAVEAPTDGIPVLFAEELISEKSLDEVILAFLSADLEQGK